MSPPKLEFSTAEQHRTWLSSQATLPRGFRVGTTRFEFTPVEVPKPARMAVTVIALDKPTSAFAAMFTRNAFPGAPIILGRQRLNEPSLGAIVVNNKISNVCAPGGVEAAEAVCAAAAKPLGLSPSQVLPCSTGVIGWQLPVGRMVEEVPKAIGTLSPASVMPAAEAVMTTDLYPKVRRAAVGAGSIVGFAKGAGMIEPNLATMLVFILTDLDVPREALRASLRRAVGTTFGCMSIDSDTSTSDTVALVSSAQVPCPDLAAFEAALTQVCGELTEDIVRNGEGVHHVISVKVTGAPSEEIARGVGKAIVNSPLFQCAVCGNDPNVGRLVMAIGKYLGAEGVTVDPNRTVLKMGGEVLFQDGAFRLDASLEKRLVAHMKSAELYESVVPKDGVTFRPPIAHPPHERRVEVAVELGLGKSECTVLGSDRSHEYISENADYRS